MAQQNVEDIYPLSPMQQGLLFHTLLAPEAGEYFRQLSCRMRGPLNVAAFQRAWQEVVDEHSALRSSFLYEGLEEPLQVIHRRLDLPCEQADWRDLPGQDRERRVAEFLAADRRRGFVLAEAPLMRIALLRLGENEHHFVWSYHHLLVDGWSVSLLQQQVFRSYQSLCEGSAPVRSGARPYRDYIAWLLRQDRSRAEAFWRGELAGFVAPTSIGALREAAAAPQAPTVLAEERMDLTKPETEALNAFARQHQLTLNTVMQAAWALLLSRYGGEPDVVFGGTSAGRPTDLSGFDSMIGLFINTLPVRVQVRPYMPLLAWLHDLQQKQAEARQFDFSALSDIQRWSEVPPGEPLFESLLAFENHPEDNSVTQQAGGLEIGDLRFPDSTNFPLTVIAVPGVRMQLRIAYDPVLFAAPATRLHLERLRSLLRQIAEGGARFVADLSIVLPEEQSRIQGEWNRDEDFPQPLCLHEIFEARVREQPATIAITGEGREWSYHDLDDRASRLARLLRGRGVEPEVKVGLLLERSPELIVAILGVLKAGGAYVPLDPVYPMERLSFLVEDAGIAVVLTESALAGSLPSCPVPTVCLDSTWEAEAVEADLPAASPGNLAYVIYTSGSTGRPKGVEVQHRNVTRLFAATDAWFGFGGADVWTLFHSSAFDFSVWEIWGALLFGGRLVIVPYWISRSPDAFFDLLVRERVTVLNQTPSAFRQLVQARAARSSDELALRWIVFGGEALDPQGVRAWFDLQGDERPSLVNMYGITETTVHVTFRPLARADVEQPQRSPIGRPIPDLRAYVLDEGMGLLPPGLPGEMYIGGAGVARGYLGRSELTAQRFAPDPFSSEPGARLYRTGDLARWLEDGELEYLGRADQQMKIRGFRIEPGEIEAVLCGHPGVGQAFVGLREDEPGERRLVAYFVPSSQEEPKTEELRRFLVERLPEHMIPAAFVALAAIPLTAHGKVDRRALPEPSRLRPELEGTWAAPRSATEQLLCRIWGEVLGIERVGIHDNFFALGGDSIRSIQVRSRAEEQGVRFNLQDIFQHPTVAELAQEIQGMVPRSEDSAAWPFGMLSEVERARLSPDVEDAYPLSRLQAGMVFHSELSPESAVYHDIFSYHLRAPYDAAALRRALRRLAVRHPILRTSFDLTGHAEPLQRVHREAEIPLEIEDVTALSAGRQEERVAAWLEAEKGRSFSWSVPPLVRLHVHRRGADTFQLSISFHHAVLDGWSVASLLTDLFRLYLAELGSGGEDAGPAPTATFHDYVALERQALGSAEQRSFWLERLAEATASEVPSWTGVEQVAAGRYPVALGARVAGGVRELAATLGLPLKSVLLAAHLRVLGALAGTSDVTTGLVANGRPEGLDGERVLGLFLNTLPFRLRLAGGSWADLVRNTFEAERSMIPFRRYPSSEVQRLLGGRPLFETTFNFVHFHVYRELESFEGLRVLGGSGFEQTNVPFTANFSLDPAGSRLQLDLLFHAERFGTEQLARIGAYYEHVLEAMTEDRFGLYTAVSLLSREELQQVLFSFNGAPVEVGTACLHELFERQCEATPERICVEMGDESARYGEVELWANRLAHHLRDLGIEVESGVGIFLERSVELLVSVLGVLKAGGFYVPLDPGYPWERLSAMLADSNVRVVVTHSQLADRLSGLGLRLVCLDEEAEAIARRPGDRPRSGVTTENLAYVIYTSGSTGRPKGVMVPHGAIANRLLWMQGVYPIGLGDAVLQKTAFSFDASIWELFVPLLSGARLVMAQSGGQSDASYLVDEVRRRGITVLQLVPSMLQVVLSERGLEDCRSLRRLYCGGEALPVELQERFFARMSGVELHNLYGPTEVSIDATHWECRQGVGSGTVPIGRPLWNVEVYVLDRDLEPVPLGSMGELYVGGPGLARGYRERPDLTAERFVPRAHRGEPGGRLYRTGDLARHLPDGTLEYLGRMDQQVKVRGYRIELGEIESALLGHLEVREAAVVVREDRMGDRRLVAYVVPRSSEAVSPAEIRRFLAERLPQPMVPSASVLLEALPRTPSGKLDRAALPAVDGTSRQVQEEFVAPSGAVEEAVAEIWAGVLGVEKVGAHDSFFELGGHSLLAVQIIARVRDRFEVEIPLRVLFDEPTVEGMALAVAELLLERVEVLSEDDVEILMPKIVG
ncbi:MAG TPA: amino acid adenylation domain-containing protein [Thermoanaerobaculia bacterium]|nr:amino acid adenylation domain-containing protein [Thermoanaerobaculia bacterium]